MSNNSIKHVQFSQVDYIKPPVNPGGSNKLHKELTNEFVSEIISSIQDLQEEISLNFEKSTIPYMPAIVELESKAISKSNRPTAIFNETTCPFFGDVGFSKFLIQATPDGLRNLKAKISGLQGKITLESALSTVKSITKFEPKVQISRNTEAGYYVIRLLRFEDDQVNNQIDSQFEDYLNNFSRQWTKHDSTSIRVYRVRLEESQVHEICESNVFVQSVSPSKSISSLECTPEDLLTLPIVLEVPEDDCPVVGIVDTGVSSACGPLAPWLTGQISIVPENDKISEHGTFVAGLISNASLLNGGHSHFPLCQSKVFSIEAIGASGGDFYEILNTLDMAAKNNPHIKVWNLSLGENDPVDLHGISEFGILLDEFQDKHNCLCVVSAGNFQEELRPWPPIDTYEDRISSPGDSVRALTVGSLAHNDGFVSNGKPSSFSRKGPVSNFVQKPEVVHYGGNLLENGSFCDSMAIKSICPNGYETYSVGTSVSTPIISTLAANLFHKIGERATPSLVKGLLIHSANLKGIVPQECKEYLGWGVPADVHDVLSVSDYETTLVFEGIAQKSFEVQKLPFPIPDCLRTDEGKVRGEFFITLVYQPDLDPKKSFEYCQIDVGVGLGKTDGVKFKSMVPLQASTPMNEADLAKSGDKWSPIKVYHKSFPRGTDIENWKLRVSVLNRDGYEAEGVEIPFSIILTIRDIDREQPVYNEMARLMDQYNWEVSELVVDNRIEL
ncbi:S8 family peptidase [Vibrio coralliirubri]|uniref:S8 family peptidase n=1 Tax=Vibrio coralliirubri TaxID=1516159 RepID=UPI000A3BFE1A|nr:S8 family peptidase [Vibrio coralliirubri]